MKLFNRLVSVLFVYFDARASHFDDEGTMRSFKHSNTSHHTSAACYIVHLLFVGQLVAYGRSPQCI